MDWNYVLRKSSGWSIMVLAAITLLKVIPIEASLYILAIFGAAAIIILLVWALNAIVS